MTPFREGHDISSEQPPHARLPGTVLLLLAGRGGSPRQVVSYVGNVTQRNQKNLFFHIRFQLPRHVIQPARPSVKSRRKKVVPRQRGYSGQGKLPGHLPARGGGRRAEMNSSSRGSRKQPADTSPDYNGIQ